MSKSPKWKMHTMNDYFEMYLSYFDILTIGLGEGQGVKSRKYIIRTCPLQKDGAVHGLIVADRAKERDGHLGPGTGPDSPSNYPPGGRGYCPALWPGQQVERRDSRRNPFQPFIVMPKVFSVGKERRMHHPHKSQYSLP